jgi:hypothetical protein
MKKLNFFKMFLRCRVRTKKLLDTKVKKKIQKNWKVFFFGLKLVFFRASCFGFIVKGVCPLLLPLVSLVLMHVYNMEINFSPKSHSN